MSLETEINVLYRPQFNAATSVEEVQRIGTEWLSSAIAFAIEWQWPERQIEFLRDEMERKIADRIEEVEKQRVAKAFKWVGVTVGTVAFTTIVAIAIRSLWKKGQKQLRV